MRVMRLAEFLKLPEGTIYAQGRPWYFDGLRIKGESVYSRSWWSLDPCWVLAEPSGNSFQRLDEMLEKGASYPAEDAMIRDSAYDEDPVFLVFERADLEALRAYIDTAIKATGDSNA